MQSASDMFLGWSQGKAGRHFYVRQLRDMKLSATIEGFDEELLRRYAEACGWALARAHASSGDAAMISGYMGSGGILTTRYATLQSTMPIRPSVITRRS
jgi:hypothetical protein